VKFAIFVFILITLYGGYLFLQNLSLKNELEKNVNTIQQISTELDSIKTQDPYRANTELKKEIDNIQKTFAQAVSKYESLLDLENPPKNIKGLDELFAEILVLLGKRDYSEAGKKLTELSGKIKHE